MSESTREMEVAEAGHTIGEAVQLLRHGWRVTRDGWNGKGMFLFYMPGYPDGVVANVTTQKGMGVPEGTVVKVRPYVAMCNAKGEIVPWLCSQDDLLATDWRAVGSRSGD